VDVDRSSRVRYALRAGLLLTLLAAAAAGPVAQGVGATASGPSLIGHQTTKPWTGVQHGQHLIHRAPPAIAVPTGQRATTSSAQSTRAPANLFTSGPVPTISASTIFAGMNEVNGGTAPPDTQNAAVGSHVYEGVNHAYRLLANSGSVLQTISFANFFGRSGFLYDPRVFYDRTGSNSRVYMLALEMEGTNDSNGVAKIWLAVSRSSEPTSFAASNWCRYGINAKYQAGTANSSWADFTSIGFTPTTVALSSNQELWGGGFTYDVIRTYQKSQLANNAAGCPSITSTNFRGSSTVDDGNAWTITPVDTYTAPSSFTGVSKPIYFVNTEVQPTKVYRVWRIANLGTSSPTFTYVRVAGSFQFSRPADSPQPGGGTTYRLATGFDQILQVAGLGNQITAAHGTGCQFTSGTATESCVRVVRFTVGQGSTGMTASLSRQDLFGGGDNVFFYHPSVAVNNSGTTGIGFQYSGANYYLSAGYALRSSSASAFSTAGLRGGTCTDTTDYQSGTEWNKVRTGDYTAAQTDPDDLSTFWFAGERAMSINSVCQWQTIIGAITP
jgi:hypothetical protein